MQTIDGAYKKYNEVVQAVNDYDTTSRKVQQYNIAIFDGIEKISHENEDRLKLQNKICAMKEVYNEWVIGSRPSRDVFTRFISSTDLAMIKGWLDDYQQELQEGKNSNREYIRSRFISDGFFRRECLFREVSLSQISQENRISVLERLEGNAQQETFLDFQEKIYYIYRDSEHLDEAGSKLHGGGKEQLEDLNTRVDEVVIAYLNDSDADKFMKEINGIKRRIDTLRKSIQSKIRKEVLDEKEK